MGGDANSSEQFPFEIASSTSRLDLLTLELYPGGPLRFTCLQLFISYLVMNW